MWIIAINGQDNITYQGALDELNIHQTTRGKYKVNISLCIRKSYQRTDLEEICSRFDQVRPVVSHIEILLPKKPTTPNNIGEGLKVLQRQFWKEYLFVIYDKNNCQHFQLPPQTNNTLKEQKSSVHSLIPLLRKVTVIMYGNLLHINVKMGSLRLKVLIFINTTIQGHMLNHSESTLL